MTIPTRDELVERLHAWRASDGYDADFTVAEIRRAVAEELEELHRRAEHDGMDEPGWSNAMRHMRNLIDTRLAALREPTESSALSKVAAGSRAPGRAENAQEELPDQGSSKTRIPSPEDIEAAKDALRDIAQDPGCAVPVTVTKKNPRSVQYEFGVADGHRVAAAKALAALAKLEGSS